MKEIKEKIKESWIKIEMPRQGKEMKKILKSIRLKDKDFYILSLKKVSESEALKWGNEREL